ncbi:unnamed protein product [Prorocentrum cordatum]|uniref:Uncharacterized protein n=1 Tax=Prorocentrum cordatum TaxID=2364126 RepID=A0ABN9QPU2_9DINO|nr:unnamed protein product [Polarella glacialis]
MRRPDMRIPEPRMGSPASRRLVAGAFAAPELLPGVELASGGAVGNQSSDTESTLRPLRGVLDAFQGLPWLHGTSEMAGEAERPPCTLLGHNPLSGDPCRRDEDRKGDLSSLGQSISRRSGGWQFLIFP